ncbi:N-6 DNA methylase [Phormidium sp. LEGE 05292]|uniref:N-6 DNA methylase n=1 Tax=[Phormidium] sp. LEGE 05292 TaxID=767427 RepID=UPI0018830DF7|nr:N-6 DNA methylase [Phormidium sp. LEGE 05292]MBE9224002.1 N-6 DNA methylase [Phormidium sp. LEGE 05292]
MNNFGEKANFIFGIANLIRDTFNRGKYRDVILPFTVLRRIDYVLEQTKKQVLEEYQQLKDSLPEDALDDMLRDISGYAFYNTSKYTFESLLEDPDNLAANLKDYINGFSKNMRDVLEKFDFRNTIKRLDESGLLFLVMERFKSNEIDLHPDRVSNQEMGDIFQELIRKFNEALNENPGEHFTPPDVVRLMVSLLMCLDEQALTQEYIELTVYDPCCGTGGMLISAKKWIEAMNPTATVRLFGQEVNPETYAVCKSDLYILSADGRDAEQIMFGTTLANPQHQGSFDYMLANPPYGKKWEGDKKAVEAEKKAGGRFDAGLPRISDGHGTGSLRMRLKRDVAYPQFLNWILSTSGVRDWLLLESVGATMDNLNTTILARVPLSVPPFDEQVAIASYLDRETAKIDALIAKIREGIEKLKEYRTALISAAVTGKIDVSELSD